MATWVPALLFHCRMYNREEQTEARKGDTVEVLIFCGLQAAGKSTFFQTHFAETHLLISKDLMGKSSRRGQKQTKLLQMALQAQNAVVIDNTNPTRTDRVPLVEIAHTYQAKVAGYYFATPIKQAVERNQQRTGKARVPAVALYSTAARFIEPTYAEGFDTLYYVQIAEGSTLESPTWVIEEINKP
jgi:predicted kinase